MKQREYNIINKLQKENDFERVYASNTNEDKGRSGQNQPRFACTPL